MAKRGTTIGFDEEDRQFLERRAERLSKESGLNVTISDVVREAVRKLRECESTEGVA